MDWNGLLLLLLLRSMMISAVALGLLVLVLFVGDGWQDRTSVCEVVGLFSPPQLSSV